MSHSTPDLFDPSRVDTPLSEDDVSDQIEAVTTRMFTGIPDPRVRYRVGAGMRDRIPWVMAVSGAQLVEELGSVDAAAAELGVSRQYLTRLMTNHDQPTPRARAQLEDSAAYRYGWLLGMYSLLADEYDTIRGGRGQEAWREYTKHERNALSAPHLAPGLARAAERWIRAIPQDQRAAWRDRIDEARTDVAWEELPQRLSIAEQGRAILGQSSARTRKS